MAMSFLQSAPPASPQLNKPNFGENTNSYGYYDWMLGCFYLFAGVVILSCNSVLQVDPFHQLIFPSLNKTPINFNQCFINKPFTVVE